MVAYLVMTPAIRREAYLENERIDQALCDGVLLPLLEGAL
jgi:hypothetical protein